jgi:hypothetical protein
MRVLLTCARGGDAFSQKAGEIVEVGPAEGARMIAAGQALAIDPPVREEPFRQPVLETPQPPAEPDVELVISREMPPAEEPAAADEPPAKRGRKPRRAVKKKPEQR